MNFLRVIWRAVLTAIRLLGEIRADLAVLTKLIQTTAANDSRKLDQIIDLLTILSPDHFEFTVQVEGKTPILGATHMQMTDSQRAQLSIRPVDKKNKPAPLDGVPVWTSSDETVVTVQLGKLEADGSVSADDTGLFAVAEGVAPNAKDSEGNVMPARITVSGDALIGEGTQAITGVLDVVIVAGQAINLVIDAGTPVEIP